MSVAEFSAALKNKAITEWFKTEKAQGGSASEASRKAYSASNINTLVNATSDYRSAEEVASKNSFVITKDTISKILVDLKGLQPGSRDLTELTDIYFSSFATKDVGVVVDREVIKVGKGLPAVYFPSISFKSITNLVNNILSLETSELSKRFEKGHVVGLNTELLQVTSNRIAEINTKGTTGKALLLKELENVIEYYKRLDYDSANIQPAENVELYASVQKSISKTGVTKYLVELQPKAKNQRSADEVKATIGSIRKLFTPAGLSEKAMSDLIDKLSASVTDPKFQQDLVNLKSSPNLLEMMANTVAATIAGKPIAQNYSHKNVRIASKKLPKYDLSDLRRLIKEKAAEVKELARKLRTKAPPLRNLAGQFYSLASLQLLINEHLPHVIAANMGNEGYPGGQRKILNYRTGRFATSVNVERLTQSKEGMITAFYNYMKNPYATFSEGGRQSSPKSRDPKLLIAKSIKEIAAIKVGNRMRAVLV